jgi:hypothetical protein
MFNRKPDAVFKQMIFNNVLGKRDIGIQDAFKHHFENEKWTDGKPFKDIISTEDLAEIARQLFHAAYGTANKQMHDDEKMNIRPNSAPPIPIPPCITVPKNIYSSSLQQKLFRVVGDFLDKSVEFC